LLARRDARGACITGMRDVIAYVQQFGTGSIGVVFESVRSLRSEADRTPPQPSVWPGA